MFDKMIADMLGITPKEMQEMLDGMKTLLHDGVQTLNEIKAQNTEILAKLEGLNNGGNGTKLDG